MVNNLDFLCHNLWCSVRVVDGLPRAGSHYNLGTSRGPRLAHGWFRCYGSIYEWIQLNYHTYVICLINPIWRHPRWPYPKWRPVVVLHPCISLSTHLHSTTILEGNRVDFTFTTRRPLRIHCPGGRQLPNVYQFAVINDWCTDGWHITKLPF